MQKNYIIKILESASKIAIFGHENVDGDCVGSMLGLGTLLEKQGKKVSYFTTLKPSKILNFLPNIKKIKTNFDYGNYDLLVFVDFSGYNRIGLITSKNIDYFDKNKIVVIDHHLGDNTPKHSFVLKDTEVMSACELIFETTYKHWKKYYDKNIATYLYMGLSTDSGNFRYDKGPQTPRIFDNALKLLKLGADKYLITENLFRSKTFESIKFMQKLLSRIKQDGKIIYSYYDENELSKQGIDEEEASYGQFIMQDIKGPDIIILFKKIGKRIKGSLRSKEIDVAKIAQKFGGGGHKNAAGFSIQSNLSLQKQIQEILKEIKNMN